MTLLGPQSAKPESEPNPKASSSDSNQSSNDNNGNNNVNVKEDERWGYDLYPERKGTKYKPSWTKTLLGIEGREEIDKMKCERNVYSCISNNPVVKLMMAGLNGSGCNFDIRRHISCEVCDNAVSGGYDPELNQIVVCQNTARSESIVGGVMIHEMIHMFDYCRNELDFKNIDHLACTEIRAANLTHCSFMSAWVQGSASPMNIKKQHQECVKHKAMSSVLAARNVTQEQALDAIERVFPRCYPDLEPIGRRIRRNSADMYKAFQEGPLYGYDS